MNAEKERKRPPSYFSFMGISFLLLGIGNITLLKNPESSFNLFFGTTGIPLVLGGFFLIWYAKK